MRWTGSQIERTTTSSKTPLFAKALALAAVEVLEGEPRPLARARRRFAQSDGARDRSSSFRPWPESFWGTIHERIERLARTHRTSQRGVPSVPAPANTKELAAMTVRLVEERLVNAGCTRVAALHLTWPINDQFYGIANLDMTPYGGDGVRIDLNVGARYVPLEDLVAKLSGRRV